MIYTSNQSKKLPLAMLSVSPLDTTNKLSISHGPISESPHVVYDVLYALLCYNGLCDIESKLRHWKLPMQHEGT